MSQPDPVAHAAANLMGALDKLVARKSELLRDMRRTDVRIARLRTSLTALAPTLSDTARNVLSRRLDASAETETFAAGGAAHGSNRMQVLHDFLANHPFAEVTSQAVLHHLKAHNITADPAVVARLVHAKTEQGMLRRLGRGRFSIDQSHPKLAGLRIKATPHLARPALAS